jgi:hypothetical protein
MPVVSPLPHSGRCSHCGQPWTVSAPAFDVSCPRCHTLVLRLTAAARVGHALAIAAVPAVFGGLLSLAMGTLVGATGLVIGVSLTALASAGSAVRTYRAVRKYRTVAQVVHE